MNRTTEKGNTISRRTAILLPLLLVAATFRGMLRAQTVSLGGTAALGDFLNPLTVNDGSQVCNYDLIEIDLSQGKVFARPFRNASNAGCNSTLVDITNGQNPTTTFPPPFTAALTGPINDGVLEVGNFTLRQSVLTGASTPTLTLIFVPNANNTPVWLRATGSVNIGGGTVFSVAGQAGGNTSGFLRGVGGQGGPGGFRGGDGGNGGLSPSAGGSGFGPGGGPGGLAGTSSCLNPAAGAQALTTGITVTPSSGPSTNIPAGNDLLTSMRGGAGGGGQGGCNSSPGPGGGGGGGAVLLAANNTVTINGTLSAAGGPGICCSSAAGSGGTVRLVAGTIAGSGVIDARGNSGGVSSAGGNVRLEAFAIPFTGSIFSPVNVAATSSPGQVILPSAPSAFLQFVSVTDTANGQNSAPVPPPTQATFGRTGVISSPDVQMPNPTGTPATSVTVLLAAGPNTVSTPFPAGKTATLEVAPLDPAQGAKAAYQAAISCPGAGQGNCSATFTNVSLPLGFSSMSAFTVVNLNSNGSLARNFPAQYQGEPIESVRLQTTDKGTEYTLIAKSGREFPYRPGK